MNVENLLTPANVGQRHHDLAVKAARAKERRIQHVRAVCCRDHDDVGTGFKAVHLYEHLV